MNQQSSPFPILNQNDPLINQHNTYQQNYIYPSLPTNNIPLEYQQQQHHIYANNDPFYNPYFNQNGQTYQDMNNFNNINQSADFLPASLYNSNGPLKDHDTNLNYNKYMVFFQYDSVNVFAFDFDRKKFIKCPNYYNFKMLSFFRVAQTPNFSFILTGGSHSNEIFSNNTYHYNDGYFYKQNEMKTKRRAHCSVYHEGFVYVFGGLCSDGQTKLCERFKISENRWENIASLPEERSLASCCVFGKEFIYILGGFNEFKNQDISEIVCYNVKTNMFNRAICLMPQNIENPFVAQINESEIVIMGGFNYASSMDVDDIHVVNVFNGKSAFKGKMQKPCWSAYCHPYLIRSDTFMIFTTGEDEFLPSFYEVSIT